MENTLQVDIFIFLPNTMSMAETWLRGILRGLGNTPQDLEGIRQCLLAMLRPLSHSETLKSYLPRGKLGNCRSNSDKTSLSDFFGLLSIINWSNLEHPT